MVHWPRHSWRCLIVCFEAVTFDLWGTLVDWPSADAASAVSRMAEAVGADPLDFGDAWAAAVDDRWTGGLEPSLRLICRSLGLDPTPSAVSRAIAHRVEFHLSVFLPRPDALAALRALREASYRLGLISDCSSEVPELWSGGELAPLFDAAIFSCSVGIRKPDPRIYRTACDRLMVELRECLYIGDGASDELAGATAIGMTAVKLGTGAASVPWTGRSIASLSDVAGLVSSLEGS